VLLVSATPALGRELLKNPSFERDRDGDGVPDSWHRIHNEKLSGPFALANDAQDGRRAVQLETEEWNFLRPQHIAQEVALPKGARLCALSVHAKGRGLVGLTVQFLRDGKPLVVETVDLGFGPESIPKEARSEFALEPDYSKYEAWFEIPQGTDGALVKLGNTVGPLDRLNVWGRCVLDNASFIAGGLELLAATPSQPDDLHVEGAQKDVAPFCRIRTEPPSMNPKALADGNIESAAVHYQGAARGGINRFLLPRALPIKALKLHLNGAAGGYVVRGDADGDGRCEKTIMRTSGLEGLKGWKSHQLLGEPLAAIEIQARQGSGAWGFRQCHPFATEVQILVPKDAIPEAELKQASVNRYEYPLAGGVPTIATEPAPFQVPKAKGKFRKQVCADLWMWGIHYTKDTKKGTWTKEKIRASKGFQESAAVVKDMGVDTVFIDLTNSTCWDLMPWPSKVCHGTEDNILKALIDALHEEGLKVITETLHNFTPFEPIKWHYPCEETSRYPAMKQFPSILYGGHVRDNWQTIYEEQVEAGADGVCLASDEFYYRGHFLETLPEDDAQRRDYERVYGHKVPAKEADTLEYRQWVAHTHDGLAGLFGYWNETLKKKHPNLYTCSVFMQPVQRSNLYGEGVPFDLVGMRAGVDEIGSDYMEPWGIKMLSAANGWRKVSQLFWGWHAADEPPVLLYARPLWMLMYGGGSCNYWRFYQLKESGHWQSVKKGYAMADDLEALGVWDARPPRAIAVVSSRRSWDWWQVRAFYGKLERPTDDRAIAAARGWFADELVNDKLLLQNGYPYDWYFMDNPAHLEQLAGYKVILLPFAYSMSDAAAAKIREAAQSAKIILFGSLGETDEWGRPRATPALKDLIESGKATLVEGDILEAGGDDAYMEKVLALVDAALGNEHPLKVSRYGKKVDATLLAKGDRERFLFLINWEERPATVDLSVAVPDASYTVLMRDDAQWHQVTLGGKETFTRATLRKFRRIVPPRKAEVYYIAPAASRSDTPRIGPYPWPGGST
jgi:hypothetical protein